MSWVHWDQTLRLCLEPIRLSAGKVCRFNGNSFWINITEQKGRSELFVKMDLDKCKQLWINTIDMINIQICIKRAIIQETPHTVKLVKTKYWLRF